MHCYFIFAAFLCFYHGIHETSLFDVSVAIMLFMSTFTIYERVAMVNFIIIEYIILMVIQFFFLYRSDTVLTPFTTVKIVFHIGSALTLYLFSRLTINRRVAEREKLNVWRQKVKENEHDMEDFLSNISHEFRTPVNVINGMTAILKKNEEKDEL